VLHAQLNCDGYTELAEFGVKNGVENGVEAAAEVPAPATKGVMHVRIVEEAKSGDVYLNVSVSDCVPAGPVAGGRAPAGALQLDAGCRSGRDLLCAPAMSRRPRRACRRIAS